MTDSDAGENRIAKQLVSDDGSLTNPPPAGITRFRSWRDKIFAGLCMFAMWLSVALLLGLLLGILWEGAGRLSWQFLAGRPSSFAEKASVKVALAGSLWLIGLTTLIAVPLGVGCAVYLEEYSRASFLKQMIQINISNLAGVPSIVYGILGLGLFVRGMQLKGSVIAGALTLSLVVLPIIILASQEALRSVPGSIRAASYALGATRWQTVWYQVLPAALPAMMTGVILALSRAIGETAPLIIVGAATFIQFLPTRLTDDFTALPIQIFNWTSRPQAEFHAAAGAGIIVLMALLICMNGVAIFVRYRFAKHIQW